LAVEGQPAIDLLACLAQLSSGWLPAALFDDGPAVRAAESPDPEVLTAALAELEGAGLLERGSGGRVRVDEATREYLAETLDYVERRKATEAALELVLSAFPADPGDFPNWERCEALMPELWTVTEGAEELEAESSSTAMLFALGSEYLTARGDFAGAKELASAALADVASAGPGVVAVANHALGVILIELGELDEAQRVLETALSSRSRDRAENATELRGDRLALGEVLGELGRFEDARSYLEQVRTDERVPVDRFDAQARRRLAWLLMEEGKLEEAEEDSRRALAATVELLGEAHPDSAQARGELGALLLEGGRWEEARGELTTALDLAEGLLGDEHPAVGVIASNLGGALEGLEELRKARDSVERALEIGEEALPPGHRNLWLRHRKLTRILRALKDLEAAHQHAEAAAAISERALPDEDLEAVRDQLALASLLERLGERTAARRRYEPALTRLEEIEGADPQELAGHKLVLGGLLVELDDLVSARGHLEQALETMEEDGDGARVQARIELLDLAGRLAEERAQSLESLGLPEEAEKAREQDRSARRAVLEEMIGGEDIDSILLAARAAGPEFPEQSAEAISRAHEMATAIEEEGARESALRGVMLAWSSLGLDAFLEGSYDTSREFYESALGLVEGDPAGEGGILDDLADVAAAQGDDERARDLYLDALSRKRDVGDVFEVAYTLLLLGRTQQRLEQNEEAAKAFLERLELLRSGGSSPRPIAEAVTLHDLADVRLAQGETGAAIELYGEAAELKRQGDAPEELAATLVALGRALREAGMLAEAADAFAEGVRLLRQYAEPDARAEVAALREFAELRRESGEVGAAVDLYRHALALVRREREPWAGALLFHDLAGALKEGGDLDEAAAAYGQASECWREAGQVESASHSLLDLGRVQHEQGDLDGAAASLTTALELLRSSSESNPRAEGVILHDLADVRRDESDVDAAIGLYREAVDRKRQADDDAGLVTTMSSLSVLLLNSGDGDGALALAEEAISIVRDQADPDPELTSLIALSASLGRDPERALPLLEEVHAAYERGPGSNPLNLATVLTAIASTMVELESPEVASARQAAVEAIAAALADTEVASRAEGLQASILLATRVKAGEAIEIGLEKLRALVEESPSEAAQKVLIQTLQILGRMAAKEGRFEEAAGYFRERLRLLVQLLERQPGEEGIAEHDLARVLALKGERDEAADLYRAGAAHKREAGNELGVARTLYALAGLIRKSDAAEAREAVTESVGLYRGLSEGRPIELAAALGLLALLEDDGERARQALAEAVELVEAIPAEHPQSKVARQSIASVATAVEKRGAESEKG
jgi:tetratricopeptide (TPR) repeat protein